MGPEFIGEDFFAYPVGSKPSDESVPGRPPEIDAETLRRNVLELQFVLEQNWGEVGWLLCQAETLSDVRSAFSTIVNPRCSLLEPFTADETLLSTGDDLRKLRKSVKEAEKRLYSNVSVVRDAQNSCERAFNAWANEADPVKQARIQTIRPELAESYTEAEALAQKSRLALESLRKDLMEREAGFAQSEILQFIRSNRRSFTPLNVARAMAGLPHLSARVSCERCSRSMELDVGISFKIFQTIERRIREPIVDLGGAIDGMRDHLLNSPEKKANHIVELRENWYFLEGAIRSAAREPRAARGSLAFRIFAEYTARSTTQIGSDATIAEARNLELLPGG